ncbi:MAG: phosphatidate cytidylyltransferase [Dehalococcoidia bacterium]
MSAPQLGNLSQRVLSAAVGLPLLVLVIWAGGPLLGAVAIIAAALALHEALSLLFRAGWRPLVAEGIAWGAALVILAAFRPGLFWLGLAVGASAVFVAAAVRYRAAVLPVWGATAMGAAYIALPLSSVVALRDGTAGLEWLLVAFLGTFATDTGAYAVGRLLGRHRMAPSISPGKTWEGAAGGLLAGTAAVTALLALLGGIPFVIWAAVLLGLAVAIVSQAGDLLESKLKRLAGAKDSGRLIPGHGGLLDRLDSLVLVFPLIYYATLVWPA